MTDDDPDGQSAEFRFYLKLVAVILVIVFLGRWLGIWR